MAYTGFLEYLTYTEGTLVTYRGILYVFTTTHSPGVWDASQVIQVNSTVSYTTADFNTLPNYNLSSPLAASMYHIYYHINNDEINLPSSFLSDTQSYSPGATARLLWCDTLYFSANGIWVYTFEGWGLAKGSFDDIPYNSSSTFDYTVADHDLHLYAQWSKAATIAVDASGILLLDTEFKDAIQSITIPEYLGGSRIKIIGTDAFLDSSIQEIVLPASIVEIRNNAFNGWTGTTIRFVDINSQVIDPLTGGLKYPPLKLLAGCFGNTPNLLSILLPYRWHEATGILFPVVAQKSINIYIRNSRDYMIELLNQLEEENFNVDDYIAAPSEGGSNYARVIYWGYNE